MNTVIERRQRDGVCILDLRGKITIGAGDIDLRNEILQALNDQQKRILVNLARVSSMDAAGVGEMVSSYAAARHRGAVIKICGLPSRVCDVLTVTQLITVFDVFDDEDEALRAF